MFEDFSSQDNPCRVPPFCVWKIPTLTDFSQAIADEAQTLDFSKSVSTLKRSQSSFTELQEDLSFYHFIILSFIILFYYYD